ncbi:MAG: hypothetical protein FWC10_08360 [Lentimicrobiaceae bacterium]|nr:hypothetical protein [Lentimicrobiaceae bacterium]
MKKIIYTIFITCVLFISCQDIEDLVNTEDQLVAISKVDKDFNFKTVSTFSISDTIHEIYIDGKGKETKSYVLASYQKDLIIKQMEGKGFIYIPLKEVRASNLPDLFFELICVENKYVQVGFGWWYDYYYPYWFSYWGWGTYDPYYPASYTTNSSYTAKSFVMDCMFFQQSNEHKYNAQSCFFGIVKGIADKYSEENISHYINQCFEQTPELRKN